ncbi:hypothetical protein SAMN05192576_2595 [Nocardioides szechwanensis]|uniref:Uncharacterized protein n=1 Tax=Nocardioides szechwanensis TaxID=1005944 RepID=A0A1H0DK55_9ACTN|nr:hypothetical protein SAMN05192576_2595 [Nocardioides szechwanensis]
MIYDEPLQVAVLIVAGILSGLFLLVWWREQDDDEKPE